MTDTNGPQPTGAGFRSADEVLKPLVDAGRESAARIAGMSGEMHAMVLGMAQDNAAHFADAMGAIATAKTPLKGATIYSQYLMTSMQRVSKQFMDVTQAAAKQANKGS